ncbi:MAG: UDP-N-acetylglucosamine 2-epimerase (non-hydrolyzing) [Bryobacterales bacterium]|nr:UDP-N-acetylglucosamine 2-epimerase (non-hydrolyzing) [Bryobacterales bacterium]
MAPTWKVSCVVGARPNFIKMAPLMAELLRRPTWQAQLIHTGQHYSPEMSDQFFADLQIPRPDVHLGLSGGTPTRQTADILIGLEPVLDSFRPDVLIVVGDVTSTIAGALTAVRLGLKVAHVEAGLRSRDRTMPEEINRIVTDSLSDFLFITEPSGRENLLAEGVPESRIFFVGNVMIDTLLRFRQKAAESTILDQLGLQEKGYAVATLHRPANVDDPKRLPDLIGVLTKIAAHLPVVFPVHPRTQKRIVDLGLSTAGLTLCPPQGYLDFLRLTSAARLVLTDSGGIQEETTILQVPCLTLRENTERPVTIHEGTNHLVGLDPARIYDKAAEVLNSPPPGGAPRVPKHWDGQASRRIIDILEQQLGGRP